jgi:hypothetical protein
MSARKCSVFEMSNYPDGMTSRDWAHIDGIEHHEDCPYHDDFQGINNASECYCGIIIGEDDMCVCDCMCDTLYPSKYDIELEKLGL